MSSAHEAKLAALDAGLNLGWAEGVRRSAEFMRQHQDEPNTYMPRHFNCAICEADCWDEDSDEAVATKCHQCEDQWLCGEHRGQICPACVSELSPDVYRPDE